jgi:hypothetical protein
MELTIILSNGSKRSFSLSLSDTVKTLKQALSKEVSVPDYAIRLFFSGVELKPDTRALFSFDIGKFGNWNIHATLKVIDITASAPEKPSSSSSLKNEVIDLTDETNHPEVTMPSASTSRSKRKRSSEDAPVSSSSGVIDLTSSSSTSAADGSSTSAAAVPVANADDTLQVSEDIPQRRSASATRRRVAPAIKMTRRKPARARRPVDYEDEEEEYGEEPVVEPSSQRDAKQEVRASRFRTGTYQDELRVGRALSQRLYLLNQANTSSSDTNLERQYDVLGSTGNVYKISIGKTPTCDCPGKLCLRLF